MTKMKEMYGYFDRRNGRGLRKREDRSTTNQNTMNSISIREDRLDSGLFHSEVARPLLAAVGVPG